VLCLKRGGFLLVFQGVPRPPLTSPPFFLDFSFSPPCFFLDYVRPCLLLRSCTKVVSIRSIPSQFCWCSPFSLYPDPGLFCSSSFYFSKISTAVPPFVAIIWSHVACVVGGENGIFFFSPVYTSCSAFLFTIAVSVMNSAYLGLNPFV